MNDYDDLKNAVTMESFAEGRKSWLAKDMENAAMRLHDLLLEGVKLRFVEGPQGNETEHTLVLNDKISDTSIAIRLPAKQLVYPGIQAYWDLAAENQRLRRQLDESKTEIKALRVMVPGSDEVL